MLHLTRGRKHFLELVYHNGKKCIHDTAKHDAELTVSDLKKKNNPSLILLKFCP